MTSIKCISCGLDNLESDSFCRRCGTHLVNNSFQDRSSLTDVTPSNLKGYGSYTPSPTIDYSHPPAYGNPSLPPTGYSPRPYGRAYPQQGGVWHDGNTLVMHKNASLPDRCIKCNAAAQGSQLKRRLTWHHPAWALLVFAGLLFYLIAALIVRKSAEVNLGLCETHIKRRRTAIIISWLLFLLGLGGVILGIGQENGTYALIGIALILASIVYAVVEVQVATVSKMDDQYIWLKRVNKDYLAQLPQLPKSP